MSLRFDSLLSPTISLARSASATMPYFGAYPRGSHLVLSTLRAFARAEHARLALRRRSSALPGRDFHPWVTTRGFGLLHGLSPLPDFVARQAAGYSGRP